MFAPASCLRSDKIVRKNFGQPNGWPGARSAESESHGWDEHIPLHATSRSIGESHKGLSMGSRMACRQRQAWRVRRWIGPKIDGTPDLTSKNHSGRCSVLVNRSDRCHPYRHASLWRPNGSPASLYRTSVNARAVVFNSMNYRTFSQDR